MRSISLQDSADLSRVVIEHVSPELECGRFPIKRIIGESVRVEADIYGDGHDRVCAWLLHRKAGETDWTRQLMQPMGNDRWRATFDVAEMGTFQYTVEAWVDHFLTWRDAIDKKIRAGSEITVDLEVGARQVASAAQRASGLDAKLLNEFANVLREFQDRSRAMNAALHPDLHSLMRRNPDRRPAARYERELSVNVDRKRAGFSAWYELFPRSCTQTPDQKHGTLRQCAELIPAIADMGFDVLYLPPIHPIGTTSRKGRRNAPNADTEDPGSPWAIGSPDGGHTAIHSLLGTLDDLRDLVERARGRGIEVALDLAFQCSPDHPYLREHPEWFSWRPDGTIQFAENPPKRYEDIVPFNFETEDQEGLWTELRRIVLFWIDKGITIFRVDNPHTKPFAFWEWLIAEIRTLHPGILFLSEAFTRPKIMYRLAKLGFSQSYTYFIWRITKKELREYLTELTQTEVGEYFRPNFWPNTPDILPEFLQYGGRPAFMLRLILAATLSPNYGIYGPAFELCVGEATPGREEYLDSEKYEIVHWDRQAPGNIGSLIRHLNRIRRENPALQSMHHLTFRDVDNDDLLFYEKSSGNGADRILVIVSLDPFHSQEGVVRVPIDEMGLNETQPYLVHDLLSGDRFIWQGRDIRVRIDPNVMPAMLIRVHHHLRREQDFDYYQ